MSKISCNEGKTEYLVTVEGRADFKSAPRLREFAQQMSKMDFEKIWIDFRNCTWMDSTFMGVLAMIVQVVFKKKSVCYACNASAENKNLLRGLGIDRFFQFVDVEPSSELSKVPYGDTEDDQSQGVSASTVLEAHKTLMAVDERNVSKFENVVKLIEKDEMLGGK